MTEITWKTPPVSNHPGGSHRGKAAEFVNILKANPGRWAFYGRKPSSNGDYLRRRYGVEVTYRETREKKSDIYVRWNQEG